MAGEVRGGVGSVDAFLVVGGGGSAARWGLGVCTTRQNATS